MYACGVLFSNDIKIPPTRMLEIGVSHELSPNEEKAKAL